MEITKSDFVAFAYTVKFNKPLLDPPTDADYKPFFDRLDKYKIRVEFKISELDKRGHLHYHGILYLRKGFYRKRCCIPGMHIKLDELYDKKGWVKYIHKDVCHYALELEAEDLESEEYIEDTHNIKMPKHSLF